MDSSFCKIWAVPKRLIFWSSSILMFPGILSSYFPRPFLTRPSAPITTGTVLSLVIIIIIIIIIIIVIIIIISFYIHLITTSTIPQKSLPECLFISSTFEGGGGGGGGRGLNREGESLFERRA